MLEGQMKECGSGTWRGLPSYQPYLLEFVLVRSPGNPHDRLKHVHHVVAGAGIAHLQADGKLTQNMVNSSLLGRGEANERRRRWSSTSWLHLWSSTTRSEFLFRHLNRGAFRGVSNSHY